MAEDNRDVLMMLIVKGAAIDAECTAVVDTADLLCAGFRSAPATGKGKGNYFAISDFGLQLGLQSDDSNDDASETENNRKRFEHTSQQIQFLMNAQQKAAQGKPPIAGRSMTEFGRFMNNGAAGLRTRSYSSDLDPISITKQLDISSLRLFDLCQSGTLIDSAVIIKRRGGGADKLRTYLRLEFTELMVTDFDWQDDEVVKETFKFVCRKVQLSYKVEKPDGTLEPATYPGMWKYRIPEQ